jgi:CubicO group peptidase (beta-lactamase class C family)
VDSVIAEIEAIVGEKAVPSMSVAIYVDGARIFAISRGFARIEPPRTVVPDQPYDLASITKALVGSTCVAALVEAGEIGLEDRVSRWLPDVDARVTITHLLTHSAGYPAWVPLYRLAAGGTDRRAVLQAARRVPLVAIPGERWTYSDLGFLTLLQVIEAVGGPIEALWRSRVLEPSGVTDLRWGWAEAAATERCPVRRRLVEGTVHDLNCEAIRGISSHAGLFGTATAVAALADALRAAVADPDSSPLPGRSLGAMWNLRGAGSHVGGWDTPTPGGSTGSRFPSDSRGHLGYTGGSVWTVPSRRTTVSVLTNRVHPVDDRSKIRLVRPRIHDAIAQGLGWA